MFDTTVISNACRELNTHLNAFLRMFGDRHRALPDEYNDINDLHVHKCGKCGSTWQHPRDGGPDCDTKEKHEKAHSCPNCGTVEYYKADLIGLTEITYPWEGEVYPPPALGVNERTNLIKKQERLDGLF